MSFMEHLILYAYQFVGIPYIFGGQHPAQGLDCSEYVQIILRYGGFKFEKDMTAAALYDHFKHAPCTPQPGALAFYGKPGIHISHVAFCVNSFQILEAGGGHSDTFTVQKAIEQRAFIRGSFLNCRTDLTGVFLPDYPRLIEEIGHV